MFPHCVDTPQLGQRECAHSDLPVNVPLATELTGHTVPCTVTGPHQTSEQSTEYLQRTLPDLGQLEDPSTADEAIELVCSDAPELTELDLGKSVRGIQTARLKELAEALTRNSHLRSLKINRAGIRDVGAGLFAKALLRNSTLEAIDLSWNAIAVGGARHLGVLLSHSEVLRELHLGGNTAIGDEGCEALGLALGPSSRLEVSHSGLIVIIRI